MNQQTPTDNDHLFRASRHQQAAPQPTGPASWLTAPRIGFTAMQDAKRTQLSNSKMGRCVGAGIIIGHIRIAGRR